MLRAYGPIPEHSWKNTRLGVCDIYRLQYYHNCCFNDVQIDNIEYFAKTKQNAPTECTHTLADVVINEAG